FGSGYLVAADRVLTAGHVVAAATGPCEVRPLGSRHWLPAQIVWEGEEDCDAALLSIEAQPLEQARLGRVAGDERVRFRAVGFPWAQAKDDLRDTEEIAGELPPLTNRKTGAFALDIGGSVPLPRDSAERSPW